MRRNSSIKSLESSPIVVEVKQHVQHQVPCIDAIKIPELCYTPVSGNTANDEPELFNAEEFDIFTDYTPEESTQMI